MSSNNNRGRMNSKATIQSNATSKLSKRSGQQIHSDSQTRIRRTIFGGASRTVLSSSSRKTLQLTGSEKICNNLRAPVQVFDETGRDVTPLPLIDSTSVKKNQSNILTDSVGGTPTDPLSQASIYQTGTVMASTFGGGPFTRSVFSTSQSGRSTGSISDDLNEPLSDFTPAFTDVQHKREEYVEELTEEDLDQDITINLEETDTIWLLDLPSVCVSNEADEAPDVREQIERYKKVEKSKTGNDQYVEREMNTFNEPLKYKQVQTNKIGYNEVGVCATIWDMYDTYKLVDEREEKSVEVDQETTEELRLSRTASTVHSSHSRDIEDQNTASNKPSSSILTTKGDEVSSLNKTSQSSAKKHTKISVLESEVTQSSMNDSIFMSKETPVVPNQEKSSADDVKQILQSEEFLRDLVTIERVINLNTYQPKQALYRELPIVAQSQPTAIQDDKKSKKKDTQQKKLIDMGPNLDRLWTYTCSLTKSNNVSAMTWNKVNLDLLAVSYGQYEFLSQKPGLVCCWSLKNPEFPERVYNTKVGVTALDFSRSHPNLLAVGLYDGTIAIYNVRSTSSEPILDSFNSIGKHIGPVWQLKWIEKERGSGEDERVEVLVSISTDGRITQWSIRKGFESYDLMKLKKTSTKSGSHKSKKAEAFISRYAGGTCFDFSAKDTNIYLAGTEEGFIHKCSCSYNEQYLDSYFGHTGPIYKLAWNPFVPDVFLSASGDWSIRLWHQDQAEPVLNFFSSTKSVPDICWSPRNSTVFACVNEGSVEVWDLSQSTLDPIIVANPSPGVKLSSVLFAQNTECLLVGDSDGQVSVYQLRSVPKLTTNKLSKDEQFLALDQIVQASRLNQAQQKQNKSK